MTTTFKAVRVSQQSPTRRQHSCNSNNILYIEIETNRYRTHTHTHVAFLPYCCMVSGGKKYESREINCFRVCVVFKRLARCAFFSSPRDLAQQKFSRDLAHDTLAHIYIKINKNERIPTINLSDKSHVYVCVWTVYKITRGTTIAAADVRGANIKLI